MAEYDDIARGSDVVPDDPANLPPPDAEGLDNPDEVEDTLDDTADAFNDGGNDEAAKADDSDDDSLLSDVDEAVLDWDENKLDVAPDFDQLRSTKIKKRKREEGEESRPKKKERTRERARRRRGGSEGVDAPDGDAGGRRRAVGGERKPRERVEIDEETLPPEERRRRALDRAMDAAMKRSNAPRKKRGEVVSSPVHTQRQILTTAGP